MRFDICLKVASLAFLGCLAAAVEAQQKPQLPGGYPARPVRILVGQPPGGSGDTNARRLAQKYSERWGAQFVVENKAGANGLLAIRMLAQSDPDGYTLFLTGSGLILAAAMNQLDFDALKAIAPVAQLTTQPYVMLVDKSVPANSVGELMALAKSKPGTLNFASQGVGSIAHMGMEMLRGRAGVEMVHVPYKGTGPAIVDLRSGQIQLMFASVTSGGPQVKSGALKGLAVTSLTRLGALPDIPTVAESGFPEFELGNGTGLYTVGQTPQAIVEALNREAAQIVNSPEFRAQLSSDGAEPAAPNTPAQFRLSIERAIVRWAAFIKATGIKPES